MTRRPRSATYAELSHLAIEISDRLVKAMLDHQRMNKAMRAELLAIVALINAALRRSNGHPPQG